MVCDVGVRKFGIHCLRFALTAKAVHLTFTFIFQFVCTEDIFKRWSCHIRNSAILIFKVSLWVYIKLTI